jgi:hypothetical protein
VSLAFLAIGGGLLYKVNIDTPSSRLIGCQIIYSLGVGLNSECSFSLRASRQPTQGSSGSYCDSLIRPTVLWHVQSRYWQCYFKCRSQEISAFVRSISKHSESCWGFCPSNLGSEGELRTLVIKAYLRSLNNVYIAVVPVSLLIILSALLIRNVSLKSKGLA